MTPDEYLDLDNKYAPGSTNRQQLIWGGGDEASFCQGWDAALEQIAKQEPVADRCAICGLTFTEAHKRETAAPPAGEAERLRHDIEAYRSALGYAIPGGHDGKLSDGTKPKNGIAEALERTSKAACPYIVTSSEGTSHCSIAEKDGKRAEQAVALLREHLEIFAACPACQDRTERIRAFIGDYGASHPQGT